MASFGYIRTCEDVLEHDLEKAATDRTHFKALVAHLAEIATPNSGAGKVLAVCARVIKDEMSWADGTLRINLTNEGTSTKVEVLSDSAGLVERLFPAFTFRVPLREFATLVEKSPKVVAPFEVLSVSTKKLSLTGTCTNGVNPPTTSDDDVSLDDSENSFPKRDEFLGSTELGVAPPPKRTDQATLPPERLPTMQFERVEAPRPKPAMPETPTRAMPAVKIPAASQPPRAIQEPLPAAPARPKARNIAELGDDEFPNSERLTLPGEPPSGLIKESRDTVATVPPPTRRLTKEQEAKILDQPASTARGASDNDEINALSLDDLE